MKLNNKGFAITTIIYGTLVIFLLLLASLLGILSTHKVRLQKLKEKTIEIIDPIKLECKINAVPSGETIGDGYYSTMTLTINSNKSNVTYKLDGKNVSEITLSSTKTGTVTYSGTIEKDDEKATCSINISQRTEYRKRACKAEYQWTTSGPEYSTSNSICSISDANKYYTCSTVNPEACNLPSGQTATVSCFAVRTHTRSCYRGECNSNWGSWTTTSSSNSCSSEVEKRTTYAAE